MSHYDLFNGDADGICALTQLRLAEPKDSTLITGVKRDIALMEKISPESGDSITVLDISMDKNKQPLQSALDRGAEVFYCDHHFAGDIPEHDRLTALINTSADVCTALLVNGHLKGKFLEWAVVGAFGDNLKNSAAIAAKPLNLSDGQLEQLENLGIYINYNGYGSDLADLHFHPEELYRQVSQHSSPFGFMADGKDAFDKLQDGYREDMASAAAVTAEHTAKSGAVFILPDAPWARRVSGVYSNDLANGSPQRAHAVLTQKANGNYLISVRAPLSNKTGADELVRQFPTGGGRAAAAGINDLPAAGLSRFIDTFEKHFAAILD